MRGFSKRLSTWDDFVLRTKDHMSGWTGATGAESVAINMYS